MMDNGWCLDIKIGRRRLWKGPIMQPSSCWLLLQQHADDDDDGGGGDQIYARDFLRRQERDLLGKSR